MYWDSGSLFQGVLATAMLTVCCSPPNISPSPNGSAAAIGPVCRTLTDCPYSGGWYDCSCVPGHGEMHCIRASRSGEPCLLQDPAGSYALGLRCEQGFICRIDVQSSRCEALETQPAGGSCFVSADCEIGLFCGEQGECLVQSSSGETCEWSAWLGDSCRASGFCGVDRRCHVPGLDGAECSTRAPWETCAAGATCVGEPENPGVCVALLDTGSTCRNGRACRSGFCVDNRCSVEPAACDP